MQLFLFLLSYRTQAGWEAIHSEPVPHRHSSYYYSGNNTSGMKENLKQQTHHSNLNWRRILKIPGVQELYPLWRKARKFIEYLPQMILSCLKGPLEKDPAFLFIPHLAGLRCHYRSLHTATLPKKVKKKDHQKLPSKVSAGVDA